MSDPVIAQNGHTYDRTNIAAGSAINLKTQDRTLAENLIPNIAIKQMCDCYFDAHPELKSHRPS